MAPPKKRLMKDALAALDDDESCSDDEDQVDDESEPDAAKPGAVPKQKIELDALKRAGYSSGPSLLLIPKQPDEPETDWRWGESKESIVAKSPTAEERAEMREIATARIASDAELCQKAVEHNDVLYQQKQLEKAERLKKKQPLSFREKEKRKRNAGMQSSDKNYVEEEKRIAREHGCYDGF